MVVASGRFCYYCLPMRHAPLTVSQPGRAHRHRFESPFWRKVMIAGIRGIPQPLQLLSMPLWAGIFYSLVPSARRAVERNLGRVLGEASSLATRWTSFRLFVNYAQSLANLYALYFDQPVPLTPTFHGREKLEAARAQGRGTVLVTGHLGYWALGPFLLEQHGFEAPVMAMAEEPNARTHAFEQRLRERWDIVYTTGSPFASLELASRLRRGELVAMQLDRHIGGARMEVPFFGRPASFPLGPATLARATQAPLLPVFMVRQGARGVSFHVEDPIEVRRSADRDADVREATARMVAVYERYVRRYPTQWFNFHDFWSDARQTEPAPGHGASADETAPERTWE